MSLRWVWYLLTFCAGLIVASTLFIFSQPSTGPTGFAIADTSLPDINESVLADESMSTVSDFQNNISSIISGKCERNPYTALRRNYSHLCTLFYNSSVGIRSVGYSGSMWPALIGGGYAIFVNVTNSSELMTGDIIIINETVYGQEVVHRIIEIANDTDGLYVMTKGDNNTVPDGKRVRFSEIVGRVVGVLY